MPSGNNASSNSNRSSSTSPRPQPPSHTLRDLCAAFGLLVLLQQALALLPGAGADRTGSAAAAFQPPSPPSSRRHPPLRWAPAAAATTTRRMASANDNDEPGVVPLIDVPADRDGVRLYSISDIHCDYKQNLQWFRQWCGQIQARKGKTYSMLLIPGDIASNPVTFRSALEAARASFDETVIVPGNHDLWHSSSLQAEGVTNSLEKLEWIHRVAAEVGVRSRPCRLRTPKGTLLYLVPLLSWYHPSWDTEPDLPPDVLAALYDGRASFEQRWADFRLCKWPEAVVSKDDFVSTTTTSTALADTFAAMNDPFLARDPLLADPDARDNTVVISFSHFLPRIELCPEKRFLIEPSLTKVIGSVPLCRQVTALRPDIHIFGHSHIPIDMRLDDGVRYLQWPLGSVSEQSRQCAEMSRVGPALIYDDTPEGRGLAEILETRWGEHYRETPRQPLDFQLAPWVRSYWNAGRKFK